MNASSAAETTLRTVLHVGCGIANPAKLPAAFFDPVGWREIRLDIDPDVQPDIVGTTTDMVDVPSASVDAVWSAHNVEHLYAHEVPAAFAEFRRVLKPAGFALITVPDLQQVARLIVEDGLEDAAYLSSMGPIAPLDVLYGHRPSIAQGNAFMAHRTGFTARTLQAGLMRAGFPVVKVQRDGSFALWAAAYV